MNIPDLCIPLNIEIYIEQLCILDVMADIGFNTQHQYEELLKYMRDELGVGFVEILIKSETYADAYIIAKQELTNFIKNETN